MINGYSGYRFNVKEENREENNRGTKRMKFFLNIIH